MARKGWRRVSTWRPRRQGSETLDIHQLISPWRYDVVVRAQFFDFLSEDRARSDADLRRAALDQPYFTWFRDVECARFFPELLGRPDQLRNRFEGRVIRAMSTLRSYERHGFDARWPVTVLSTRSQAVTDSGLPVGGRLHIGDGCHRLALLLRDGRDLEPNMYLVRSATGPVIDNTAVLLPSLSVSQGEYVRFLSAGFVPSQHSDLADLRAEVGRVCPGRLDELGAAVRAHLPLIS